MRGLGYKSGQFAFVRATGQVRRQVVVVVASGGSSKSRNRHGPPSTPRLLALQPYVIESVTHGNGNHLLHVQVAVADTDHLGWSLSLMPTMRTSTSVETKTKDFVQCYSNSVLKPLLLLDEKGEGGEPRPHNLGFVKLLVDEIEARHQLLKANAATLKATERGVVQLSFSCIHAWLYVKTARYCRGQRDPSGCDWPSPGSVRRDLALKETSGEPAGRSLHNATPCFCHRHGCGRREPRSCRPKRWRAPPHSISCRAAGVRARTPSRQGQRWRRVAATRATSTLGGGRRPRPQVCALRAGGSATAMSPRTAHRTAPLTTRGRGHYTRRMAATSSNSARRGASGAPTAVTSQSRKLDIEAPPPPASGSANAHRAHYTRPLAGRGTPHSSFARSGRPPGMISGLETRCA